MGLNDIYFSFSVCLNFENPIDFTYYGFPLRIAKHKIEINKPINHIMKLTYMTKTPECMKDKKIETLIPSTIGRNGNRKFQLPADV